MWELFHGGWLAPNMYYLGHAGCVQVNNVRIAGVSGIYKFHDFRLGYHEKLPYDQSTVRSAYHIREFAVRKLSLLSSPRIFLSHDWPQSIEHHGDIRALLRHKGFLRADIDAGKLGSPPLLGLLRTLKPERWFAAHLHTYYEATVDHEATSSSQMVPPAVRNPEEIVIDDLDDLDGETSTQPISNATDRERHDSVNVESQRGPDELVRSEYASTKFLALDKCLPGRKYLEVVDLPSDTQDGEEQPVKLSFDPEWLAITKAFQPWLSTDRSQRPFPDENEARQMVGKELAWVTEHIPQKLGPDYAILECQRFSRTAPGPDDIDRSGKPPYYPNPQTAALCALLEMENKIEAT